jgi:nucleotide-binding universal stress UspA family protein
MSYKTILVHVDQSPHAAARIHIAAQIALDQGAHLVGVAMTGISRFLYQDSAIDLNRTIIAQHIDFLNDQAQQALAQFDAIAKNMGVPSIENRLVHDEAEGGLAVHARYADLVVLSQSDPDTPISGVITDLPEYVMLNCARPVLIVPHAGQFPHPGSHPLIAWDASIGATRAVTNAIPMLRRASKVTLVLINPSSQLDAHGDEPGADIATYLARHGINIEVVVQQTHVDIGNALLSLAADLQSDLLVMGGYGHTRFRELIIGGVTKTLLETMTLPVLMSH